MISQLFRGLPKFVYVGGIPSLTQNSTTTISCVSSKIRKALTLNNNPLFLTYHPIGVMIAIMVYEVRHLDRGLVVVVLTSASFGQANGH